ncbi:MAG: VPLPA-CTERM sorting domain-containing protein [Jannaschia sp.]
MNRILAAACTATFALGTPAAEASTFDILTTFTPGGETVSTTAGNTAISEGFSIRQRQLLSVAESFWENVLVGFSGLGSASFALTATMAAIDGAYGTAAFAGPKTFKYVKGTDPTSGADKTFVRATGGRMVFDADDFGAGASTPQSEETFLTAAIHEVAHAVGFGTLFSYNGLLDSAGQRYIGGEAVAAFNATNGTSVASLLLQDGGGHWSECWVADATGAACSAEDGSGAPGLFNDSEILSAVLPRGEPTFAAASIAAFRDLGFLTIDPSAGLRIPGVPTAVAPVPLPAGGVLMLAGLGGLAALRRKRRG